MGNARAKQCHVHKDVGVLDHPGARCRAKGGSDSRFAEQLEQRGPQSSDIADGNVPAGHAISDALAYSSRS